MTQDEALNTHLDHTVIDRYMEKQQQLYSRICVADPEHRHDPPMQYISHIPHRIQTAENAGVGTWTAINHLKQDIAFTDIHHLYCVLRQKQEEPRRKPTDTIPNGPNYRFNKNCRNHQNATTHNKPEFRDGPAPEISSRETPTRKTNNVTTLRTPRLTSNIPKTLTHVTMPVTLRFSNLTAQLATLLAIVNIHCCASYDSTS